MDMFEKQDATPGTEARLQAIEAKLDAIMAHLGIGAVREFPGAGPSDPRSMPDVMDLVRRDRLIQAIKLYRERTGVGLKEAKDAVDRVR